MVQKFCNGSIIFFFAGTIFLSKIRTNTQNVFLITVNHGHSNQCTDRQRKSLRGRRNGKTSQRGNVFRHNPLLEEIEEGT